MYPYKCWSKDTGRGESDGVGWELRHFDLGADEAEDDWLEELPEDAEGERHLVLAHLPTLLGERGAGPEGGHDHRQRPSARQTDPVKAQNRHQSAQQQQKHTDRNHVRLETLKVLKII